MPQVDAEHRGPLINIATWTTLVFMILITASKVATKWKMARRLQNDDVFMVLAMLTAVGHCITVSMQVQSGLGQPERNLPKQQFDSYQKATYASQIFYIITIFLVKMAALQFLITLTRPVYRQTVTKGAFGLVIAWLVTAVFCVLFQCKVPQTWNQASGRCYNLLAFWIVNGVIDILTQLLIAVAPIYLLFNLQLPISKKRLAMASFIPNITTIPLIILRLVYLFQASHSSDATFSSVDAALVTDIHTNYSIIAGCLPFLKPLVDSLAIGLMTNDIRVPIRSDESSQGQIRINPFAILGGRAFNTRNFYGWTRSQSSGYSSTVTAGKEAGVELRDTLKQYGSQERMVISQTKTVDVSSAVQTPR